MGKEKFFCIYFLFLVFVILEVFFRDRFNIIIWIIIFFYKFVINLYILNVLKKIDFEFFLWVIFCEYNFF